MAYLDNTSPVNGKIFLMTLPALAFLVFRLLETANVTESFASIQELLPLVNGLAAISPIFVVIQISMMVSGTARRSAQNIFLTIITATASVMAWQATSYVA